MTRACSLTVLGATVVVLLAGCAGAATDVPSEEDAVVTGNVTAAEAVDLPEGAVVKVQLQDVSLMDAPAEVLSSDEVADPGALPVPFLLPYDPAQIDERMSYAVSARIEDTEGALLMINTNVVPVLTRGAPASNVDVFVESVAP
jgi:putative lipoprotein